MEEALALIGGIVDGLEGGKNIAVHCRQGIGRSGLVTAGVLMSSGATVERAIRMVSSARGLDVPETSEQCLWLKRLASRTPVLQCWHPQI